MKRFFLTIIFCTLFFAGIFLIFLPTTEAESDLVSNLLELPAPPPVNPLMNSDNNKRPEEFYDPQKPPRDDAPIDELMDYWGHQAITKPNLSYSIKPSSEVLQRIKAEIEKDPKKLVFYLNIFRENTDGIEFVKRLYDEELVNQNFERYWRDDVKHWLTYNSPYFSNKLLQLALQVQEMPEGYIINDAELLALAKVDWDKALPILERLISNDNQPLLQTLARWAFYQRALDTGNQSEAEKYRKQLQTTVENKNLSSESRDLAIDALVCGGDFEGRDEWYLKLLEDETLHYSKGYRGLTTIVSHSPDDKYTARFVELLRSDSKTIRSAAIRLLAFNGKIKNPEIIRSLLPWLEDPDWANDIVGSRESLIYALAEIKMPESVPGLIAALNQKRKTIQYGNLNVNVTANSDYRPIEIETYTYRYAAIQALANQRDSRAIPALKALLAETEGWQKNLVVSALLKCNGFSVSEQVEAAEMIVRADFQVEEEVNKTSNTVPVTNSVTNQNRKYNTVANIYENSDYNNPEYLKALLGIAVIQNTEPTDEVVWAMADRIGVLEKTEPKVAKIMRGYVRSWKVTAVNILMLRDVRDGKTELENIIELLARRKELREKQLSEIYAIRTNELGIGLSACLLEQTREYDAILNGENSEAKAVMLACARLIRASLPIRKVAENLSDSSKTLAIAAEKYLESEDSPEARAIILSLYPNKAKILGARSYFGETIWNKELLMRLFNSVAPSDWYFIYSDFSELDKIEKNLQKEVLENAELLGIYSYDKNFVRIYQDKVIFSWEDDPARFRERVLEEDEFERLKNYLVSNDVENLKPFLSYCGEEGCEQKEFLMLGRNGGRRIYLQAYEPPPFFVGLEKIFEDFRRPPSKLRYYLQNSLPLEVLFENENLHAETVWKNGMDFRVLINNQPKLKQIEKELEIQDEEDAEKITEQYEDIYGQSEKRRKARAFESYSWYQFDGTGLRGLANQPTGVSFIPKRDQFAIQPDQRQWKSQTATVEIRTDAEGLFKVTGGQITKIRSGQYYNQVVTPNGRWVLAQKYGGDDEKGYISLVRIDLSTNREFKILPTTDFPIEPIVFVPAQNKVLAGVKNYYEDEYYNQQMPEPHKAFFWLIPETGALAEVKGNVEPLAQQTFRPLQPVTGKTDEFWAAVPDSGKKQTRIGTYNARTLAFKALLTLPQIEFDSMKMWVDEADQKVYVAYQGHLLSIRLKTQ
jgi:hypothetical protein